MRIGREEKTPWSDDCNEILHRVGIPDVITRNNFSDHRFGGFGGTGFECPLSIDVVVFKTLWYYRASVWYLDVLNNKYSLLFVVACEAKNAPFNYFLQ